MVVYNDGTNEQRQWAEEANIVSFCRSFIRERIQNEIVLLIQKIFSCGYGRTIIWPWMMDTAIRPWWKKRWRPVLCNHAVVIGLVVRLFLAWLLPLLLDSERYIPGLAYTDIDLYVCAALVYSYRPDHCTRMLLLLSISRKDALDRVVYSHQKTQSHRRAVACIDMFVRRQSRVFRRGCLCTTRGKSVSTSDVPIHSLSCGSACRLAIQTSRTLPVLYRRYTLWMDYSLVSSSPSTRSYQ
jgi:hypothetical protein